MSAEVVHTFGCGCRADDATGFPISTCRRHDQRSALVRASAALQQMGNHLDEAGKAVGPMSAVCYELCSAARYAVKAAKALIGADETP